MKRFLALFALTCLLPSLSFAQDTNLGAQLRLERVINNLLDGQEKAFEQTGGEFVRKGDISVEKTADYFAVTLPEIQLKTAAGDITDLGIISINAAPKGAEEWLLTLALPMPLKTLNAAGTEISRVDVGKQFFVGTWNESFGNFSNVKTLYENVKVTLPDNTYTAKKLGYGFNLKSINEQTANIGLQVGFEGMAASAPIAGFNKLMPKNFELDVDFAELPLNQLHKLDNLVANPGEIGDTILSMLAGSGSVLTINDAHLTGNEYTLKMIGEAKGDPESKLKAFGNLILDVTGIDNLLVGLNEAGSAVPPEARAKAQAARMALTVMATLGANQTDDAGSAVKRYEVDIRPDGKIMMNGTDFTSVGALFLK